MLWDAGFNDLESVEDELAGDELGRAREVLGVPSLAEVRSRSYWESRLGMEPHEFEAHLRGRGIHLSPRATKLPQGALKALRTSVDRDPVLAARSARISAEEGARAAEAEPPADPVPPAPPIEWRPIGWEKEVTLLTAAEVLHVHERLVADSRRTKEPISPAGVRSHNLFESAVGRPATSLGSALKYPTVEMAAAALVHSLVHNHPFYNGNKRTALVSMVAMLDRNNLLITATQDELFRFMLRVAQHRLIDRRWDNLADREVLEIAAWIRANDRPLARDERPLKWRELKQILRRYGCEFSIRTGNRLNISRTVSRTGGLFRRSRDELLSCQASHPDDGREVDRNTIHYIRKELELDEEHDVDSEVFYAEAEIDDFIARYRRILRELAKL